MKSMPTLLYGVHDSSINEIIAIYPIEEDAVDCAENCDQNHYEAFAEKGLVDSDPPVYTVVRLRGVLIPEGAN